MGCTSELSELLYITNPKYPIANMQDSHPKLFNHDEAADYINVSKRTLRKLVDQRLIPVIRLNARTLRFNRSAIDAALAGLTISAR